MKNFYNITVAALIGFMVGAIPRLWPWQHETANRISYELPVCNIGLFWNIAACMAGLILVLVIEFWAKKKQNKEV